MNQLSLEQDIRQFHYYLGAFIVILAVEINLFTVNESVIFFNSLSNLLSYSNIIFRNSLYS